MKKLILFILVVALSSALSIAVLTFSETIGNNLISPGSIPKMPSVLASYNIKDIRSSLPDFTGIAEHVTKAVVHIKSVKTIRYSKNNNYYNPFRDMFGDDLFEQFFGPSYPYNKQEPNERKEEIASTGSGVIISTDGYIITNNHVVAEADNIEITLNDKRTYRAKVIGTDPSTDIALLQIKESDLTSISFGDSDSLLIGEWVLAVGNPFNLNSTVTAGIVSAKARNINILKDNSAIESFIQTDAAINPGNSGGALVDLNGNLIGINTAIASPTGAYAGYAFAIPSNIVKKVCEDIIKYGIVQRGYLGIYIRDIDGEIAKKKDLDVTEGVYVDSLMENSAAETAGIRTGDVIIEIDAQIIKSAPELQEIIGRHRPGDEISIKCDRKGKLLTFKVILKNKEGKINLSHSSEKSSDILTKLGIEVKEIDSKTATELNIDGGMKVVKIKDGIIRINTNMREGFIITGIDNKPIKTKEDIYNTLNNKSGGVLIEGMYEDYPGVLYYAFGM